MSHMSSLFTRSSLARTSKRGSVGSAEYACERLRVETGWVISSDEAVVRAPAIRNRVENRRDC